jgi:hypothetical protein
LLYEIYFEKETKSLDSIKEYLKDKENFKNHHSIYGIIKNYIRKVYRISLEEYLNKKYFNIRKCNFCNDFVPIIEFNLIEFKNNILYIDDIIYKNNSYYCYHYNKNCVGRLLNPNSIEFVSKSKNISKENALQLIHLRNKTSFYSNNHNSKEEYKISQSRNKIFYINKYGEIKGNKKWELYCKKQSYVGVKLEYFIEKYGKLEGNKKYKEVNKKKDSSSFEYFLFKYKDYKIAKEKYKEKIEKCCSNSYRNFKCNGVSKESLKILIKYYKFFRKCDINKEEIFIGMGKNSEYYLKDENGKKYFYDFCIPKINLIIEYHGEFWHPNPKWKKENIEIWNNWYNPIIKISADDKYKLDSNKKNIAKNNNYNIFEIYSSDDKENIFDNITKNYIDK